MNNGLYGLCFSRTTARAALYANSFDAPTTNVSSVRRRLLGALVAPRRGVRAAGGDDDDVTVLGRRLPDNSGSTANEISGTDPMTRSTAALISRRKWPSSQPARNGFGTPIFRRPSASEKRVQSWNQIRTFGAPPRPARASG